MTKFKKSRKGRPRKTGARYTNGRLKPVDPRNPRVAEIRKSMCEDLTKASCPLDVALANKWISTAEYSAAMTYANTYRAAKLDAPGCKTAADLSTPTSALDMRGLRFADLSDGEIVAIWDGVASHTKRGATSDEESQAIALERWRRMNEGMSPAARSELQLVSIYESWPQWINQLVVVRNIRARAEEDKRQLTVAEEIKIARCENSPYMAKKTLLAQACAHVRSVLSQPKIESAPTREGEIVPIPGPKVAETVNYVDPTGAKVLEVVRIRRKG